MNSSTLPLVVGIDLGTTNSAIAVVRDGHLEVIPVHGQSTMPSAVGLDPAGRLIIGQAARNQLISAPENTVLSIKRHMGTGHQVTLGERTFSPEEISALILGELKRAAEAHLGQPVTQAVITVPAFFDEAQRKATQTAGHLAGLEVLRIINEPTAAALAYGAGELNDGAETILVYDLGGGTFDVSVVEVDKGIVEVKASHGDTKLGGDDFDAALAGLAEERFRAQPGADAELAPGARRRLTSVMERVKIQLSDDPFVPVLEEYLTGAHHLQTEVSREDYETLIDPWLTKTLDCVQRALTDAKLTPAKIDKVLLAGGATRTPLVQALLSSRLGREPRHEINPDLIVAMGAAIQGAALAGQPAPAILIDITAHTYSIEALDYIGNTPVLAASPVIRRGTPLPVRRSEPYSTVMENQPTAEIKVYQGEGTLAHENTLLGEFRVEGLQRGPRGNTIVVQFQLDLNGLLTVTATEKSTGLVKAVTIDTHGQHRLNLDAARANLDALFAEAEGDDEGGLIDGEGDDDEADDADDDEAVAVPVAGGAAPAGLLASAKDLRRRADALLARGIPDKDAADLRARLEACSTALQARDWPALQDQTDSLSDILFYLED